jgi:tripartite-type tricarboxylate transporter receptor subunit TctC
MKQLPGWPLLLALALSAAPVAAVYPDKPLRLVAPFPPGGSVDLVGRHLAQRLSENLKQRVVVDNRPGAGGGIGAALVAKATPDGYTLLLGGVSTHGINPTLYPDLPYDPVRDFAPICLLVTMPNVVVVNPALPLRSLSDLVAYARAHPGQVTYASSGNGTTLHLAGEMFMRAANIKMVHVPYRGGAPALADLLGGQVQVMFDNIPISLQMVRSGKLRALAVTGARRSPAVPDLPTVAESGYPGYAVISWQGLFAPAGTPAPIITKLNQEVRKVLLDQDLREQLSRDGIETAGNSPVELAAFVRAEIARWAKIVRDSGAKLD